MVQRVVHHDSRESRSWMVLTAYILGGLLFLGWLIHAYFNTPASGESVIAMAGGLFTAAYSVAGVAAHGALFRDAIYLREAASHWRPKWWKYIGAAILLPTIIALASTLFITQNEAIAAGLFGHAIGVFVMCLVYLYNRHLRIGVP